jgi:hypothetical protein
MRGSVRQFALSLLAFAYTVLWTLGVSWHAATCPHLHESVAIHGDDVAAPHDECCHSRCCEARHTAKADGKHRDSETPEEHPFCGMCQLFAQSIACPQVVAVEAALECVEQHALLQAPAIPCSEPILARPRGPPIC